MNKYKQGKSGFSLVELMVVVAIIGILASIGIQKWKEYRSQSRDSMRKTALTQLYKALEIYHANEDAYPNTGGVWWGYIPDSAGTSHQGWFSPDKELTGDNGYIPGLAPAYVMELPVDPIGLEEICSSCGYIYKSDGNGYKLTSHGSTDPLRIGGPENLPAAGEKFHDPIRPTWAIMVCEGATACAW